MLILGIFAMSYDLLLGYTGILSFGHAMFFGTGGYVIAILIGRNFNWSFGMALLAVIVVALLQGLIFGILSLRVKGVYLAMVTLDADPRVNFYSNLPGTAPYQAPVGAAVEVMFEEVASGQLIHEWRVVG